MPIPGKHIKIQLHTNFSLEKEADFYKKIPSTPKAIRGKHTRGRSCLPLTL
jgi:hypothetical protein